MRIIFLSCLLYCSYYSHAQQPVVPSRMEFAGIKLRIMDDARREIQKDVDALTASPKYYEIKAERARTYFPIIERVFKEERLPQDFKYLCLQESALISDAVSTSNAVGFWQFKDFTAVEVGMRVDRTVDERKNIVASTRGAARYMHKNNQFFDNWLHALQAYQMGAGGAMKVLDKGHRGSKSMVINKKTYWYVKKYLAHKVAFEGVTRKQASIEVSEYYDGEGKTLKEIAQEYGLDENEVAKYNKWLSKGRIPSDKKYAVILPQPGIGGGETIIAQQSDDSSRDVEYEFDEPGEFPKIEDPLDAQAGKIVEINGLPGIVASRLDRIPALADKAGIPLRKFLKYNDLGIDGTLIPGQVYYMKAKRGKAKAYYHIVEYGETLWSISQKFGIKLKKLKAKNRIKGEATLKEGRVLWLRYVRPANTAIEYKEVATKPVQKIEATKETAVQKPDLIEDEPAAIEVNPAQNARQDTLSTKRHMVDSLAVQPANERVVESDNEEADKSIFQEELIDVTVKEESEMTEKSKVKKTYEVKMGDTYYAISRQFKVAVLDILEWNGLKISDKLSIGQKLTIFYFEEDITKVKEEAHSSILHTVKEGETLYGIAREYGVSLQEILDWNDKTNSSIKMDEKLIIKR